MLWITIEGYSLDERRIKELKDHLWEYFGDVGKDEITILTDGEY